MQAALRCHHVDMLHVLACSFVRICDEGDEALQPEWEIDPKDLQLMEKVRSPLKPSCRACLQHLLCVSPSKSAQTHQGPHASISAVHLHMKCQEMALPTQRLILLSRG